MIYLNANQVVAAVRELYAKNGNVVLTEVRNGTGFSKRTRTADVVVASTWPSRGLYLDGFEVKVNRGDLRRELADPEKAEAIAQYCLHWYLAVPQGLIAEDMIVPENWGVVECDGDSATTIKAKIAKPAPPLSPKPPDMLLVCSILRNFADSHIPKAEADKYVKKNTCAAVEQAKIQDEIRIKELELAIAEFKEHSGVDLLDNHGRPSWNIKAIGEAVKLVTGFHGRPAREMNKARKVMQDGLALIEQAVSLVGLVEAQTLVAVDSEE